MKSDVVEFSSRFGLSPREIEVLGCLTDKIIHFKDIATHLKLSPSTVNNHFKSIFDKTGTNSKSELLATFLRHVLGKYNHCRHLVKKPQVIVLDDEPDICEFLVEELAQRGIKSYPFSNPRDALASISDLKIDAIVSDLRMPGMDGIQFLREVRKVNRYFPFVLFVSGYSERETIDRVMDIGAVALLDKPIDINRLFSLIMEQFIENGEERNRYLALDEKITSLVNGKLKLKISSIGFGGVFIPVSPNEMTEDLEVGGLVSFDFNLNDDAPSISAKGEVVWKRENQNPQQTNDVGGETLAPGIGVKFVDISDMDRERVRDYVRLNRILSFIPRGRVSDSPA
jgi:DNA-binding NarL/FixJ family response regulator